MSSNYRFTGDYRDSTESFFHVDLIHNYGKISKPGDFAGYKKCFIEFIMRVHITPNCTIIGILVKKQKCKV